MAYFFESLITELTSPRDLLAVKSSKRDKDVTIKTNNRTRSEL